jgi:hypothetical protein
VDVVVDVVVGVGFGLGDMRAVKAFLGGGFVVGEVA